MDFDVIIIGCGVVGLSCAVFLAPKYSTLVIERHDSFGKETSSRNSEVIHSGIYYPSETFKAKFCVEGNNSIYNWCRNYNVPHKKIGKFIVACEKSEIPQLEKLYQNAISNDVEATFLSGKDIQKKEPNVRSIAGLWLPSTGIINSHRFMVSLFAEAKKNNCMFAFQHNVVELEYTGEYYKIFVQTPDGNTYYTSSRFVINSAGLESDTIAKLLGLNIDNLGYDLQWAKGSYFRIKSSKNNIAKHLIYPVPPQNSSFLGVHLTIELDGNLKLGPDLEFLPERIQDLSVPENRAKLFFESASRYLSGLQLDDLFPDQAGIRPKLNKHSGYPDFIIKEETENGYPGFVNLIGIESPGLTCCLEIGKYVSSIIN